MARFDNARESSTAFPHQVAPAKLFIIIRFSRSTSQQPKKREILEESGGRGNTGPRPKTAHRLREKHGVRTSIRLESRLGPARGPPLIHLTSRPCDQDSSTMLFWSQLTANEIAGLTAVVLGGTAYYVGLVLLSILAIVLAVHAYRVWQEINEVEEADPPATCWNRSNRPMRKESWTTKNSSGSGDSSNRGIEPGRVGRSRRRLGAERVRPARRDPTRDQASSITRPVWTLSISAEQSRRACRASSPDRGSEGRFVATASVASVVHGRNRPPDRPTQFGTFHRPVRLDHRERRGHVPLAPEVGKLEGEGDLLQVDLETVRKGRPSGLAPRRRRRRPGWGRHRGTGSTGARRCRG